MLHAVSRDTTTGSRWFASVTTDQRRTLLAAMLGWMLDAMDFVLFLMAITTLQAQFGFGTDTSGLLATAALFAAAVGGVLFGVVADKVGRTRALMATILIYSLCSLGTATAQSLTQLIIWRTLLGLGMGGEWASGAVLVSETWPAQHRDKAMSIMQSGWAVGYILAAVIAALVLPILGWRWLFAIGVAPALLVLWVRRHVPEPAVWFAQHKTTGPAARPLRQIFGRKLLARTVTATLVTTAVMCGYWGLFSWIPAFLASPVEHGGAGLSIVGSTAWIIPMQLGAFLGYLAFGFIAERLGRRLTFIAFMAAAALLVPAYGALARSPSALMVFGPFIGFFGHGYFSMFGTFLAELFPTSVRATGQGFTYNTGRAVGSAAPYVIGALARETGIGPALALTSAFFAVGALLVLLVPKPTAEELYPTRSAHVVPPG